ncbi:FAD-binding protein [Gordonia pseudamarae]|jgi:3-oxosteroid 1-dehydrogenase|uniref:FAD-binding protein n=1 Tax=Gordonia pseudamarae TaxID=2831662 RepID=A0ABX6IEJ9_9ACTN|nr:MULTISPECIES: FAD-binding protein [Gordonia]MBD0021724.1 FAD-binding protein [Gordonia sp. (in: high G+C Gram-positive bacteria)]QHN25302.1 FAD-binding protein [Gordonia pseudamarae]QHN34234.1 FAD-binding protein [Gordonia pseudamarae]
MPEWDHVTDLLVIGSGGGLVGALRAAALGLDVVVAEKTDKIGGSTGMSGGIVWLPDNPLMKREGVPDSLDDARAYFDSVAGKAEECSPASSQARRETYLTAGNEMFDFLEDEGVRFVRCEGYSDYYSGARGVVGGHARSRSVEAVAFDTRELGEQAGLLRPPVAGDLTMYTYEAGYVSNLRTRKGMSVMARVMRRTIGGRLRGKKLVTNGAALIAHLLKALGNRGVPVWTETSLVELVVADGTVVGAVLNKGAPGDGKGGGRTLRIGVRGGVLLAAGGFSRNQRMRDEFAGDQPGQVAWTSANPGDTGEVLRLAMGIGAATDMMDEGWWMPSWLLADGTPSMTLSERCKPHSIIVDTHGNRYFNEAVAYQEAGQLMFAHEKKTGGALPSWLIIDSRHRSHYTFATAAPGMTPRTWIADGVMKKAATLDDLARQCGIDPVALARTVERFNGFAHTGVDEDFHRGEGDHERYQGDATHRPNACLGAIAKAPFYAVAMYPGDIGTNGGLLCDEAGRVLNTDGNVISGLYAAGNCTASVMGRKYLGAGATIGPSVIFSYVAAADAARRVAADASTSSPVNSEQ